MPVVSPSAAALTLAACLSLFGLPAVGEASVTLMNAQGASAPCIGIGHIGGPAAEYCARMFEQAGFVRVAAVGVSGLTLGRSGADDAVVQRVEPGSPAAQAGVLVGDVVTAVDDRPIRPTLSRIAAERTFGPRGGVLHLTVRRAGATLDCSLTRSLQPTRDAPVSTNPLVGIHPLVNWRGAFIPCMGIGPLGFAALAYCTNKYKPYGYLKIADAGATGLQLDLASDRPVATAIEPGSPAAASGVRPGDEIVAIDGKPLSASSGGAASEALFGKAGDSKRLTVRRGGSVRTLTFALAANPS